MEINDSSTGASTYAMKRAIEMPNLLLDLLQQTADANQQSLAAERSPEADRLDVSAAAGKGTLINIVA